MVNAELLMSSNESGYDASYVNFSSLPPFSQMAFSLSIGKDATLPLMPLTTTRISHSSGSGGLISCTSKAPPLIIEYGSLLVSMLPLRSGDDGTTATRPSVEKVLLHHLLPMMSSLA